MSSIGTIVLFLSALVFVTWTNGAHSTEQFSLQQDKSKFKGLTAPRKAFRFTCAAGTVLARIFSEYSPQHRDRSFGFKCRRVKVITHKCIWTQFQNEFQRNFAYPCPGRYLIAGVRSYFNSKKVDRRWAFRCCSIKCGMRLSCGTSKRLNNFYSVMNYRTPCGYYLKEMRSKFKQTDREWRVGLCKIH